MAGRVIQGFFVGGHARPLPGSTHAAAPGASTSPAIGPPGPAFAPNTQPVQRHGGSGSFAVDPMQLGLSRGGGTPLPASLLAKMEAAFGADFSTVRVHVGPQAARIGAIAFTTGNDLYFAPGRYQPDSVQGQQLIGHELAHVIQQRQGRVRMPGSGVSVVQDHALEAEADRLGMRAAMHRAPVQAKMASEAALPRGAAPIQAARSRATARATHPEGAEPPYHRFTLNGVSYLHDRRSRRWRWDPRGHWVRMPGRAVPLYNRFGVGTLGRGGIRAASFASRMGTGASYTNRRRLTSLTPAFEVREPTRAARTYRANMVIATTLEGVIATGSATAYATHFGAPGGVVYNWCHIIGHGAGGSDHANNIMAGTTHANSEQLQIERIVYQLRRRGLQLRGGAQNHVGQYLARYLWIQVLLNGDPIYSRWIDAWRLTAPTFRELQRVERDLLEALHDATE